MKTECQKTLPIYIFSNLTLNLTLMSIFLANANCLLSNKQEAEWNIWNAIFLSERWKDLVKILGNLEVFHMKGEKT